MAKIAIQMGHTWLKVGPTGTSGHRGTEQQYAYALARAIEVVLSWSDVPHEVHLLTAYEAVPEGTDIFLALHQDGSTNPEARGASCGFPVTIANLVYTANWKALYQFFGFSGGFRPDNYTRDLAGYYGLSMPNAKQATCQVIFEHGFATNPEEEDWMWDHIAVTAWVHAQAINRTLGLPPIQYKGPTA